MKKLVLLTILAATSFQLLAMDAPQYDEEPPRWIEGYNWTHQEAEQFKIENPLTIQLFAAINSQNVDDVRALIAAGADINKEHYSHRTPLQRAIEVGNTDICKLLLEENPQKITYKVGPDAPIHPLWQIALRNKNYPLFQLVHDHQKRFLIIMCCLRRMKQAKSLFGAFAYNNAKQIFNFPSHSHSPINKKRYGWTVLMGAVAYQDYEQCKILLKNGANPDIIGQFKGEEPFSAITIARKKLADNLEKYHHWADSAFEMTDRDIKHRPVKTSRAILNLLLKYSKK